MDSGIFAVPGNASPVTPVNVGQTGVSDAGGPQMAPVVGVTASAPLASSGGTNPNLSFTGILAVANGGSGTATPSLVAGANITITGTWPNQTIAAAAAGVLSVTASAPLASSGGGNPNISFTGILAIASGGTGTTTPGLVAGTNIGLSGSWPNQTVAFSGILPIANGGTGTSTPGLVAGGGIAISGSWPNQTIAAAPPLLTNFDATVAGISGLTHFWPFNDVAGSTQAADSVGATPLALNGNCVFGIPGITHDGETCAMIPQDTTSETDFFTFPNGVMPAAISAYTMMIGFQWGGNRAGMQNQLVNPTIWSMDAGKNLDLASSSGTLSLAVLGGAATDPLIGMPTAWHTPILAFITWDGTNLKAYLSGLLCWSGLNTGVRPTQGSNGAIGRWANTPSQNAFCGKIAKAAVWNVALTLAQIRTITQQF